MRTWKTWIIIVLSMVMLMAFGTASASADELTKLATPTDLQWSRADDYDGSYKSRFGMISWKQVAPTQNKYWIEIYKVGENEPVLGLEYSVESTSSNHVYSEDFFTHDIEESGTYYFTVSAKGDGTSYCDSDIATSDYLTYTAPTSRLPVMDVNGLSWDGNTMQWEGLDDETQVACYEVLIVYSSTLTGEKIFTFSSWGYDLLYSEQLLDEDLAENGEGYYFFSVRALSNDITKILNGPWSDYSPAYNQTATSSLVAGKLNDILNDNEVTAEEVVDRLTDGVTASQLKEAMSADNSGEGVTQLLKELEEKAKVTTVIDVDDSLSASIDASEISVVGAGLNTQEGADTSTTLSISPVTENIVIPEQVKNALSFSMGLNNTDVDGEDLRIPVKITMPIPVSINPAFLVILHYNSNFDYEEIQGQYVFLKDQKWYVSFVLTHFSDFAFAETLSMESKEIIDPEAYFDGATCEISGTLPSFDTNVLVCYALYDAAGKMLSVETEIIASNDVDRSLYCVLAVKAGASYIKIFTLDEAGVPRNQEKKIILKVKTEGGGGSGGGGGVAVDE